MAFIPLTINMKTVVRHLYESGRAAHRSWQQETMPRIVSLHRNSCSVDSPPQLLKELGAAAVCVRTSESVYRKPAQTRSTNFFSSSELKSVSRPATSVTSKASCTNSRIWSTVRVPSQTV